MSVCSLTMRPCLDVRCGFGHCVNGGYHGDICPGCLELIILHIGCTCDDEPEKDEA